MKKFRVIFMGTPEFAVPCLAALYEHCDVIGVVTQPDKPRGRGQKLVPSPVKAWAEAHGDPRLHVHNDGTCDDDTKRGAIGMAIPTREQVLDMMRSHPARLHAESLQSLYEKEHKHEIA